MKLHLPPGITCAADLIGKTIALDGGTARVMPRSGTAPTPTPSPAPAPQAAPAHDPVVAARRDAEWNARNNARLDAIIAQGWVEVSPGRTVSITDLRGVRMVKLDVLGRLCEHPNATTRAIARKEWRRRIMDK